MATIVQLFCENCGCDFNVKKGSEKKTCSRECRWELRKKEDEIFYETKTCKICNEDFTSKKKEKRIYCSIKCRDKAKKIRSREIRICRQCNNTFDERKKYKRSFCSDVCRLEWQSKPENIEKRIKKSREKIMEKYGVDSTLKLKSFQEKYNKGNPQYIDKALKGRRKKRDEKIVKRFKEIGYDVLSTTGDTLIIKHPDGHIFENRRNLLVSRLNNDVELSTKILPVSASRSSLEIFITRILDKCNIVYETNKRKFLKSNKEIDVFIKDYNLCIEVNGLHWHSEFYMTKNYHYDKMIECQDMGYNLIQFFEDEIIEKPQIVESILKNNLGLNENMIFANECEIKEVNDNNLIREFLEDNHIQGYVKSSHNVGLFYKDELISLITFGKTRNEYEMFRICNKLNINVVNSLSVLFNYFLKKNNPDKIITYIDRRFDDGKLYDKLGMILVSETKPKYSYVVGKKRKHKSKFTKKRLIKEGFDSNQTEHEIMLNRKMPRIYDCGTLKYVYKKTTK